MDGKRNVIFAICQDKEVGNLHDFAMLFRDKLHYSAALFLNGDVWRMLVEPEGNPMTIDLGAVFVITK